MDLNPLEDALGQQPEGEDQHVEAPAEAAPAAETPEAMASELDRERDAQGRFAAKAKAETPAPPQQPSEPGHVPISALLDEREQRQAAQKAQRELQERFERERSEWQAANREPVSPEEQFQAALYQQNLRISRRFAEREYGPELIAKVHDWAKAKCDADPFFNGQMRSSEDPYGAAVQAYNREQIAAEVSPADFEAFKAWKAANAAVPAVSAPIPPQPAPAAPPRSLTHAPGNGLARGGDTGPVPEEGAAFSAAFT